MKSYTVYLIRHAAVDERAKGRYIGRTDVEISDEGAARLRRLKNEFVYPPAAAVFTSPLKRCVETAEILYPDARPLVIDGFTEYNFGEFENKTVEELKNDPVFPRWLAGEKGVGPPFGEDDASFEKRIRTTFEKVAEGLLKTGTTDSAVVTHGGVIAALLSVYGVPEMDMSAWSCENGRGFTIKLNAALWSRARKFEVFSKFPYEREKTPD